MSTNSETRIVETLPIIGIQHEVKSENSESQMQVEYLVLNPTILSENLRGGDYYSLLYLFDLMNSGSRLALDYLSKPRKDNLLFGSLIKDENAKVFLNTLSCVSTFEIVNKLIVLQDIRSKDEYPFKFTFPKKEIDDFFSVPFEF